MASPEWSATRSVDAARLDTRRSVALAVRAMIMVIWGRLMPGATVRGLREVFEKSDSAPRVTRTPPDPFIMSQMCQRRKQDFSF